MKKINKKLAAVDIAECAIFIALMVAGTYISIPFYPVPLTFQTVICVLSGLMLGWKKGGIAMAVYCLMGLIGIPVFSGGGGIYYVTKSTFGYIIGFIFAAIAAGLIRGNDVKAPFWRYLVAALAAFIVNYAIGVPYFIVIWTNLYGIEDLASKIVANLLCMPKDFVLCVLAAVLAVKVTPIVYSGRAKFGERTPENRTKISEDEQKAQQ